VSGNAKLQHILNANSNKIIYLTPELINGQRTDTNGKNISAKSNLKELEVLERVW
jgi:hypothetical protein